MPREFTIEKVRNIGLLAAFGAGKMTTIGRMLQHAGNGSSSEINREMKTAAAAMCLRWRDFRVTLVDTPGYADFVAEITRSFRVLDGAIACFDGTQGVVAQSETFWRQADKCRVPRVAYINKMDFIGADFDMAYKSIIKLLGANACPIQWPIGAGTNFIGIVDLIKMKALIWKAGEFSAEWDEVEIPANMKLKADACRQKIIEKIVDFDDHLRGRYLSGDMEFAETEIKWALRKGVLRCEIFPVLCGSSYENKGIQLLLDAVCDYLPSPLDLPPIQGRDITDETKIIERRADDEEPFSALIFKIQTDPFVGKLIFFRIYSGMLKVGDTVMFGNNRNTERIGRILRIRGGQREGIAEVRAGDIAATVALKNGRVGYTMCDPEHPVLLEQIIFPEPVMSVAIEPKTKADEERMASALSRMAEEDQTFRVKLDVETGQTIVSGMGELHLDIIVSRIKHDFKVEANVGKPQVAYRETVRKKIREECKFIRRTGERGMYGHVVLEIEPQPLGKGFEFTNDVKQGRIPRGYIPAVETGVREALDGGALAGFPIIDIKVTLLEGSYHDVDSSEMAFKIAGAMALRAGCKKANPTILEPIMKCEVSTPEQHMGDVIGDLNGRRAKILEMGDRGNLKFVRCMVPLSEMFGYATSVRSITQGRASFTMELSHFEEVPGSILKSFLDDDGPGGLPLAGRPVKPIRPLPGLPGAAKKDIPNRDE